MAKYRVIGPISGPVGVGEVSTTWPEFGGVIDLDADLSGMVEAGHLERVSAKPAAKKAEKRPAPTADVETR